MSDPDSLAADDGFLRPCPGPFDLLGFFFWAPLLEFWLEVLEVAGFFSSFDCEEDCCTATWSVISFVMLLVLGSFLRVLGRFPGCF